MTLSTWLLLITIIITLYITYLLIKYFRNKKKDEAVSKILITAGLGLIINSFGSFDDKLFDLLNNTTTETNYIQLAVGSALLTIGIAFTFYIKNKLYIININGYFDKRIEQHYQDLNLNPFEFKEREVEFIRLFQKGVNANISEEIQEKLHDKITSFISESKEKKRGYTGIAPIPFIFIVGRLFAREKIDSFFEYDKLDQSYYPLKTYTKREKPYSELKAISTIDSTSSEDIVLAISVTQKISDSDLSQFTYPTIHLSVEQPKDNYIRYMEQLESYTKTIYETLINLPDQLKNVKRIHLIYSGQSCLALEVGKLIDNQRMVEIINYQFDLKNSPKYPWGIVLNGHRQGEFVNFQTERHLIKN